MNATDLNYCRLIDKKELKKLITYSPSTIARLEKKGEFPKRIQLGPGRIAWLLREVLAWIESKMEKAPAKTSFSNKTGEARQ